MLAAHAQLQALSDIDQKLERYPDERERINSALFGVSNKLGVHPADLALYILIRTYRL